MTTVSLLKYQALGNDFFVSLDVGALAERPGGGELDGDLVRRLCDRKRGVGADGLIALRPARAGGAVAMELRNADGGRAETSGNGLSCLALALVDAGAVTGRSMEIETDAGQVLVELGPRSHEGFVEVSVHMGTVKVRGPEPLGSLWHGAGAAGLSAYTAEVGNPHLVVIGSSLEDLDLAEIGPVLSRTIETGRNVELIVRDGHGDLDLAVWERGAGLTDACGSGSCAAAAVGRAAGLAGDRVSVRNPGGTLLVDLQGPLESPDARLLVPASRVARIEIELEDEAAL